MTIKFLGLSWDEINQLCREEEKVMITISCFKTEELGHADGSVTKEDVLTYSYGQQIRSAKAIPLQFDFDDSVKVYFS